MTCTHPTESVRQEKRGGRTDYTCDECGAKRTDIVLGRKLHMGMWSGGRKSQEDRFDDLMERLTDWAVESGYELLLVRTSGESGISDYHLMGGHSGQMEKAVKWVQESLFGKSEGS